MIGVDGRDKDRGVIGAFDELRRVERDRTL